MSEGFNGLKEKIRELIKGPDQPKALRKEDKATITIHKAIHQRLKFQADKLGWKVWVLADEILDKGLKALEG